MERPEDDHPTLVTNGKQNLVQFIISYNIHTNICIVSVRVIRLAVVPNIQILVLQVRSNKCV